MRAAQKIEVVQAQVLPELNETQNQTLHRLWQASKDAALERIQGAKELQRLEEIENLAITELRQFLGQHLTHRAQ